MIDLLRELPSKADPSLFKVARWCTPDEGMALYTLVQAHGIQTVLECGTANGYSTHWLAQGADVVHTWDIVKRTKIWECRDGLPSWNIISHVGRFDEGVGNVYAEGPRLFFIDGDHKREAVRKDWRAVRPLIRKGDIVAFHDALEVENIADLMKNLQLIHGYRTGIIRTDRGIGVAFA
jgi:hypothetical protein